VTICTYDGINYFGEIRNKTIGLTDIGCVVWKYWYEIPEHHPHVRLGEFIVMPNHVHLTVQLIKRNIDKNSPVETFHGGCVRTQKQPIFCF